VANLDGRFHHISNAYVAGPAVFPTLGSSNPSLTAITLARRTAGAIVNASLGVEPGFNPIGTGGVDGWKMEGSGGFIELGGNIIESFGGIGLLWFTGKQFKNFILRVDGLSRIWTWAGPLKERLATTKNAPAGQARPTQATPI
jgi:hypothetical protein